MNYVVDEISLHENHAGSKARDDVNEILQKRGFVLKSLNYSYGGSITNLFKIFFFETRDLKRMLKTFKSGDMVVIQHPLICYSTYLGKIIKKISKKNDFKTVILIHDLDELRFDKFLGKFKKGRLSNLIRNEISYLDSFDYIISHNYSMSNFLISKGINSKKILNLNLFDYLADEIDVTKNNISNDHVVIAGNLDSSKAGYVYLLNNLKNNSYNFELYGVNYTGNNDSFCHYNGSFKPEELLKHINSGFGLIWDGTSLDRCTGIIGNYLKYNNPHKLSLYMACGIPVIVWKEAAIAKFVEENNVGYAIESIKEIEKIFTNLNDEVYAELKANVHKIRNNVLDGKFLNSVIDKIEIKES